MRKAKFAMAAFTVAFVADASAIPVTSTSSVSGELGIWGNSASSLRSGNFSGSDSNFSTAFLPRFDSSAGTLLSAHLTLSAVTSHPSRLMLLPEIGIQQTLQLGGRAQDTERTLHGPLNLFAYYDARMSYRADYQLQVDPLNTSLFAPTALEAAFGSCVHEEDLLFDIGDTEPYCTTGNNGSPLGAYSFDWGTFTGSQLAPFIGTSPLSFQMRMDGDMFGYCDDDDVGDYCRVHLEMEWDWNLSLSYVYEPGRPGGGDPDPDPNPNPVPVTEPLTGAALAAGLAAALLLRRRTSRFSEDRAGR
jgi:hypothetical protein